MVDLDDFINFLATKALHKTFYHFTDLKNLPEIRKHGLLSMRRIKSRGIQVKAPGGNQLSLDVDISSGMDGYVHLCFFSEHPMEYCAKQDGRIENSIFLKIDPKIIKLPGVLITDEVSNKTGCVRQPPATMLESIDWEVIYTRTDWKDEAVKERLKIAKKYEILVPDHIPTSMILNLPNG